LASSALRKRQKTLETAPGKWRSELNSRREDER